MSTIPRSSFYGSSNKTALRKRKIIEQTLNEKVKEFMHNSIPENYKQRITGPIYDWKLFYRQQSAFNYAREQSEELHVFAFESSSLGQGGGKRMYLVSSYDVFWHYYSQLPCEKKLHYEIIPEGAVCKLYFDLEFSIPDNPSKIGTKMVDTFIQYVCLWLELEFSVKCTRKDVLDLDASTDTKFSRHLIFLPPDIAFQDNIKVGNFVQHIIKALHLHCENGTNSKRMRDEQLKDSSLNDNKTVMASVWKEEMNGKEKEIGELPSTMIPGESSFIAPKKQPLEGQNKTNGNQLNNKKEIAIDSLDIENGEHCETPDEGVEKQQTSDKIFTYFTEEQLSSLFVKSKNGERTAFCDLGVYTKNRNFRLYQSCKYDKNNPLLVAPDNEFVPSTCTPYSEKSVFMQSLISNVPFSPRTRILKFDSKEKDGLKSVNKSITSIASLEGYQTSPYPEVDAFLVKHAQEIEPRGGIRHWTYFSHGELIVYEMANYRFCHNIQRSHRSNNVMFIVDLKKKIYYEKCHDPVCRSQNFKSLDFPLPQSVFPSYLWEDDPMFDGEDDDLCSAAEEAERTKPG